MKTLSVKIERHLVFQKYETLKVDIKTIKDAFDYCDKAYKRIIKKNIKAEKDFRRNSYGVQSLPGFKINGKYYQSEFDEIDKSEYVPKSQIIKR